MFERYSRIPEPASSCERCIRIEGARGAGRSIRDAEVLGETHRERSVARQHSDLDAGETELHNDVLRLSDSGRRMFSACGRIAVRRFGSVGAVSSPPLPNGVLGERRRLDRRHPPCDLPGWGRIPAPPCDPPPLDPAYVLAGMTWSSPV